MNNGGFLHEQLVTEDIGEEIFAFVAEIFDIVENGAVVCSTMPKCAPQLGRRGLYGMVGGDKNAATANTAMLWILNLSDGMHSLLDIAEPANLPFAAIRRTAQPLQHNGLLAICRDANLSMV